MEEVPESSRPENGQFQNELPEPLITPEQQPVPSQPFPKPEAYRTPNTTSLRNANLEATYNINTLPRPQESVARPLATSPEQQVTSQESLEASDNAEIAEAEFDKRHERFRYGPRQQDELAAAGMVALGDVLKNRQQTQYAQPLPNAGALSSPTAPSQTTPVSPATTAPRWSLYQRAVMVGFVAALVMAPVVIYILASR